jgi:glycerol-3-phosphate dehydrogenase subunit B
MSACDVVVIGGGLSGLVAAAAAAERDKKVVLIAKGVGAIAVGSGSIDVLGYEAGGKPVARPLAEMGKLPSNHPYARAGKQATAKAFEFFLDLCEKGGFPYSGSADVARWVPTAIGTLKPTCFLPRSMDPAPLEAAKAAVVVGFRGLKDYYPELIIRGLMQVPAYPKRFRTVIVDPEMAGRDVNALDIARWLDTESGRHACIEQMLTGIAPGNVVLVPPVLGTVPNYGVLEEFEKATTCKFIEITGMPPAITGLRLYDLLVSEIKKRGVRIVEHATVTRAVVDNGRCTAVVTHGVDRERTHPARSFILATGGFYSGGLEAGFGSAREPVFGLPVKVPESQSDWSNAFLLSGGAQPFARFGLDVDARLRPTDGSGKAVFENVYAVGRTLSGFDDAFEKSGNGVAVVTGYRAGTLVA